MFVCAHSDLFQDAVPDEWRNEIFANMAIAQQHTFQVLTKRAEEARLYLGLRSRSMLPITEVLQDVAAGGVQLPDLWGKWPLPNVWIGTSVEDRARKDRIVHLRETPAAVRFLSLEPLLEDLGELDLTGIDWAIVGGESGPNARPMHSDWARSIRDQCQAAGVAFHFKQWGEWRQALDVGTGWSNTTRWSRDGSRKTSPFQGSLTDHGEPMFGGASFRSQSVDGVIFVLPRQEARRAPPRRPHMGRDAGMIESLDTSIEGPDWNLETGEPSIALFANAVQVWAVCQDSPRVTVDAAALGSRCWRTSMRSFESSARSSTPGISRTKGSDADMKNTATDLHNHLMERLEMVCDTSLSDEELDKEIKRAKAACQIGGVIIENGRLVLEARKLVSDGVDIDEQTTPMLTAPPRQRRQRALPED